MSKFDKLPIFEWVGSKDDLNIKALMRISEDGHFIVLAESICRGDKLPYKKYSQKSIEQLIPVSKKHLKHYYKMEKELAFKYVSNAAHLVCSSITVPWGNWKSIEDGRSLREVNIALGSPLLDRGIAKKQP
jgi:hypothetical protein